MNNPLIITTTPTAEEAARCEFLVCLDFRKFRDDLAAHCCECGCEVFFRPGSPPQPRKVCFQCVVNTLLAQKGFAE